MSLSVVPKTPTLTAKPSASVVKSGSQVTLTCKTSSSGSVSYKFYNNSQEIPHTSGSSYTVSSSVSTVVTNYTCRAAISGAQSAHSRQYQLKFLGEKQSLNISLKCFIIIKVSSSTICNTLYVIIFNHHNVFTLPNVLFHRLNDFVLFPVQNMN